MDSHKIKSQQGSNSTTCGIAAKGKTSLTGLSQSQKLQKADTAKFEAKSKKMARERMEKKLGELEEKDRRLEEAAAQKVQTEKAALSSRLTDAGLNRSKQAVGKPQTTTTSAKSVADYTRASRKKQSKPASGKIWDGFITEKPSFPLTELIALKPSSSFANFYAYARRNGRTGMIRTDLIQDILKKSSRVPLDDAEMMSAIHTQPKIYQDELAAEREESKDTPRATVKRQGATDSKPMTENEITRQTFEQVCDELKTYIDDMRTGSSAESKMQQTRLCIEALTTVSEKGKELGKHSRVQQDNNEAAAASSPLSSTLFLMDPKINKKDPKKNPALPIIEAKSLGKSDSAQSLPPFLPLFPFNDLTLT